MRLILLFLAGLATGAEAACPVPKPDMRVADALIQTNRIAGIDVTNAVKQQMKLLPIICPTCKRPNGN